VRPHERARVTDDTQEEPVLDPQDIYHLDADVAASLASAPGADGPVLVHLLDGFVDAGSTAELTSDHLRDRLEARRLVTFDVDQLLSYRARRPVMIFDEDHWADYDEPRLVIDLVKDAEGTVFLLMHGREPDLQWERVAAAVQEIVDRFGVSLAVGVHGIPMAVPHTRPVGATTSATRSELVGVQPRIFGRVSVPAGFGALLERRLGEAGTDAMSFAVHVPHYLAQGQFAPAALAALRRVEITTGLDLDAESLEEAATESLEEIARQAAESEEIQGVVRALERQYDAYVEGVGRTSLLAEPVPIPTAEEIGAEFERFLAEQADAPDEDGGAETP